MDIYWLMANTPDDFTRVPSRFVLKESELMNYPRSCQSSVKYLLDTYPDKFTKEELIFFSELLDSDNIENLKMVYNIILAKDER